MPFVDSNYIFMPEEELKKSEKIKVEKAKLNALTAGVIFFMALIIILWAANLPTMLAAPKKNNTPIDINQINQKLQASFSEVQARINTIKSINPAELQKYAAQISTSTVATSSIIKK